MKPMTSALGPHLGHPDRYEKCPHQGGDYEDGQCRARDTGDRLEQGGEALDEAVRGLENSRQGRK
jgi:hypothetical protein